MTNILEKINISDVEFERATDNFKKQLENLINTESVSLLVREKFQPVDNLLAEAENTGKTDLFTASQKFCEASSLASQILDDYRDNLSLEKQKVIEDFINYLKAREAVDLAFHLLGQAVPFFDQGVDKHDLNIVKIGISRTVKFFELLSQIADEYWEFTSPKFRVALEALIYKTDENKNDFSSINVFTPLFVEVQKLVQFIKNSNPSFEDRKLTTLIEETQKNLISSIRKAIKSFKAKSVQTQNSEKAIALLNSLKANNKEDVQEQRETLEFLRNTVSKDSILEV